jgi:hypothetical protein
MSSALVDMLYERALKEEEKKGGNNERRTKRRISASARATPQRR